jgi:hypothetical protein
MTLIEHLDIIEEKLPAKFKEHARAIKEQVEAHEQERMDLEKVRKRCAQLEDEISALKAKPEHFKHPLGPLFERSKETGNQWRLICARCGNTALLEMRTPSPQAFCGNACGWPGHWLPKGTTEASLLAACPK